jgi:hypothetical protein
MRIRNTDRERKNVVTLTELLVVEKSENLFFSCVLVVGLVGSNITKSPMH